MSKTLSDLQNLRASKINETVASKILDVDLVRFYNETIAEMAQYGQRLKKVTTNIVANQEAYTESVLPGLIATALVSIDGTEAPYIGIQDYVYETDRSTTRHTIANNSLVILPKPTASKTNGLEVWYWGKHPEVVDAATGGTALAELDDKDWGVISAGVTAKCYEKLVIYFTTKREEMADATLDTLIKFHDKLEEKYKEQLENYGNQAAFFNRPAKKGPAAREDELPRGIGRQDK